MGLRYNDLYTLTLGEYDIKMRALTRKNEQEYARTRMLVYEIRISNQFIKKKPKKHTDLFKLQTIDNVKRAQHSGKATKVTRQEAEAMLKLGYEVNKHFIQ